ncbi:MAG: PmoA family protein [Pirellulales bacterium]|nr:PmoA family protein [Pirellulales bacterium]
MKRTQRRLAYRLMVVLVLLCLFAGVACPRAVAAADEASLEWHKTDGTVALRRGAETRWQFNFGPNLPKPFFDPVALPGTGSLTSNSPPDHPWHHALWFSWKTINGLNYWEENRKTGKSEGQTVWQNVNVETRPDHSARISLDFQYHPPGKEPVLTERRVIEVSAPDESGAYHMDWTATFTATSEKVVLDRTPLGNQPGGKPWGGYAGLSIRFAEAMTDWRAVDSDGQIDEEQEPTERTRIKARAVDFSGRLDGAEVGIAILDYPDNPNAPSPWYIIMSKGGPMRYLNASVIHDGPHTIPARGSFTLRYRVWIHPGRFDAEQLRQAYTRFVEESKTPGHGGE